MSIKPNINIILVTLFIKFIRKQKNTNYFNFTETIDNSSSINSSDSPIKSPIIEKSQTILYDTANLI